MGSTLGLGLVAFKRPLKSIGPVPFSINGNARSHFQATLRRKEINHLDDAVGAETSLISVFCKI